MSFRQHRPGRHISHDVKRAAELRIGPADAGAVILRCTKGGMGHAGITDQLLELGGFQRELGIRTTIGAGKRQVLFDDAGPQGDGRNRDRRSQRMVRQPDGQAKSPGKRLDSA